MKDEFRWSVEDFLGKPPLDMILEGLGALCATHLEVRDPEGGTASLGPAPDGKETSVLSPIHIQGRESGMVVGYKTREGDHRVPMTVALAASLISQFLRSTREVASLSVEIDRRNRGLSLIDRMREGKGASEEETARWFLQEALGLIGASSGVLFSVEDDRMSPLAWEGIPQTPEAGILTQQVLVTGQPLDLRSLGRFPREIAGCGDRIESFLHTPALVVPIEFGSRCLGVLWACGQCEGESFSHTDLQILSSVASQFALFLWSGRAVDTLRDEEGDRRAALSSDWLRDTYLCCETEESPLAWSSPGNQAWGTVDLANGRRACWVSFTGSGADEMDAARAVVVRATVEAESDHAHGAEDLAVSAGRVLSRIEGSGGTTHGLLVVTCDAEGGVEAAGRFVPPWLQLHGEGTDEVVDIQGDQSSWSARFQLPDGCWIEGPVEGGRLVRGVVKPE